MNNRNNRLALIRELVKDFSKVFPNIKNDDDTITIWGKQLKNFDATLINLTKEKIIGSHSGYLYPNDFIKVLKSLNKKRYDERFTYDGIPMPGSYREKLDKLTEKLNGNLHKEKR